MKALSAFLSFLLFITATLCQAQPCLRINTEAPTCTTIVGTATTVNSNYVNFFLSDITAGLHQTGNNNPRYKAFWIWGDGNFRYYPSNLDYAGDIETLRDSYAFSGLSAGFSSQRLSEAKTSAASAGPITIGYNTNVLLTEKKSNTEVPPAGIRTIQLSSANFTSTPQPFQFRVFASKTMDIFNSELNRPYYPTAFVVSAPKNDAAIEKLFFFFNSYRLGEAGTFVSGVVHDQSEAILLPNYFTSAAAPTIKTTVGDLSANFNTTFSSSVGKYKNFIELDVNNQDRDQMPADFTEVRFFPILKSTWDDNWIQINRVTGRPDTILPVARYLSISLGNAPRYSSVDDDSEEAQAFFSAIQDAFPNLSLPDAQVSDTPRLFIRGIDTLDVRMVASIDPSGIEVLKVCPIGPDKYQVKLKLEVCNEGYMGQGKFTFKITDKTALISEPNFLGYPHIIKISEDPALHNWEYGWNTYLDGVPLPGSQPTSRIEPIQNCIDTVFYTETNWQGVQQLITGNALELCIQFSVGPPYCTGNSPVTGQEYCPEAGLNCGDCPNAKMTAKDCTYSWNWYALLLLVVIFLLLIWIIILLSKNETNS